MSSDVENPAKRIPPRDAAKRQLFATATGNMSRKKQLKRIQPVKTSLLHTIQPGTSNVTDTEDNFMDAEGDNPVARKRRAADCQPDRESLSKKCTPSAVKAEKKTSSSSKKKVFAMKRAIIKLSNQKNKQVRFIDPGMTETPSLAIPSTSNAKPELSRKKTTVTLSKDQRLLDELKKIHGNVFKPGDQIEYADSDDSEAAAAATTPMKRRNMNKMATPRKRTRTRQTKKAPNAYLHLLTSEEEEEEDYAVDNSPEKRKMPIPIRRSARVASRDEPYSGDGLENNFIPFNPRNKIVYEYFDDPNELCDRLRLLLSSKLAGNTNHQQEINSIIEELRELGLIA